MLKLGRNLKNVQETANRLATATTGLESDSSTQTAVAVTVSSPLERQNEIDTR
jgi:hypothetical protein